MASKKGVAMPPLSSGRGGIDKRLLKTTFWEVSPTRHEHLLIRAVKKNANMTNEERMKFADEAEGRYEFLMRSRPWTETVSGHRSPPEESNEAFLLRLFAAMLGHHIVRFKDRFPLEGG